MMNVIYKHLDLIYFKFHSYSRKIKSRFSSLKSEDLLEKKLNVEKINTQTYVDSTQYSATHYVLCLVYV